MCQHFCGHGSLIQVAGVSSCNLHGNVLCIVGKAFLVSSVGVEVHQNADAAACMDVSSNMALEAGKTANLDVLADDQDLLLQQSVNSQLEPSALQASRASTSAGF